MNSKTYSLIASVVFFSSLGNVLLSKGMKQIGEIKSYSPSALYEVFLRTFTSGTIWLGIGSLITFFVAYMLVLSWADYSYVQPASSVAYAMVALLAHFMLR